jgi:hypothetical protein
MARGMSSRPTANTPACIQLTKLTRFIKDLLSRIDLSSRCYFKGLFTRVAKDVPTLPLQRQRESLDHAVLCHHTTSAIVHISE